MSKTRRVGEVDRVLAVKVFCGVDVSAARLDVAVQQEGVEGFRRRQFANTAAGHRQLLVWLRKLGWGVRVALEASGVYALDEAAGFEVAVLNPRKASDFARSLNRSKTDKADAEALSEHSRRMEFVRWRRP